MEKLFTFLFLIINSLAYSQQTVTLTAADMPVSGNNYEFNSASPAIQFNASQTGNNYTWDFSNLQSISTSTDSFMSVIQTPLVYNLVFNLPFDPEKSTVANNLAPIPGFGGIPLPFPITFSEKNSFYRTETGAFKQEGYAFTATYNNTPIPLAVKFDNPDIVYTLPVQFGQSPAPTSFRYEFQIPGLMTFIENTTRTNTVDGQGTLMLPNGNFDVLRIKSELLIKDSTYLDTLGFWLPTPPRTVIEYKWVSQNHGWPVLEIIGQQAGFPINQFQVNSVKYLKLAPSGIDETTIGADNIKIYPMPATDKITVEGEGITEVWLTGIDGKLVLNEKITSQQTGKYIINLKNSLEPGLYILTLQANQKYKSFKLPIR